jgi:anti-sigma regulatory factor (Ser/Thr protein kinase)
MKRSRHFSQEASSVPVARQFVTDSLSALEPGLGETAALLVSELATNAVVHASSDFAVTVVYPTSSGRVRVEVVDGVPGQPMPLQPPPTAPHGRGLLLVSSLAQKWGVEGAGRRAGKTIWFELTPAASAPAGFARARSRSRVFRRRRRGLSFFGLAPLRGVRTFA